MGGTCKRSPFWASSLRYSCLFCFPRLKLFMLVSALMGLELMKEAYAHAIEKGYRFYSYGDASLLLPGR